MVSHYNVLANILQYQTIDSIAQKKLGNDKTGQNVLGILPFSHIYGLVAVTHGNTARGDGVIVLPAFELDTYLAATEKFRIEMHYLVSYSINDMLLITTCV